MQPRLTPADCMARIQLMFAVQPSAIAYWGEGEIGGLDSGEGHAVEFAVEVEGVDVGHGRDVVDD